MLTFHEITDRNAYTQERFNFIKTVEGSESWPYIDTEGIATIGIGFNLKIEDNRNKVLEIIGINPYNSNLSAVGKAKELGYQNEIINILMKSYPKNLKGSALDQANQSLQAALDDVMDRRASDPLITIPNKENVFGLSDSEMKSVFDFIMPDYQNKVDNWVTNIPDSKERIVLESLAYNTKDGSRSLLGDKLADAIVNSNRAEAWYEICYNSNGNGIQGIANRRYNEAKEFGLYNDGAITTDDAKEVLRMYTRHELLQTNTAKKLTTYESQCPPPSGILPITDYQHNGENTCAIGKAQTYLVATYAMGTTIDGVVIVGAGLDAYQYIEKNNVSDNIEATAKNDLIFGEAGNDSIDGGSGNDVIYGGEGSDTLIGGTGNDTLIGGANNDTYIINAGDGTDTIEDKQGNNKVILCGKPLKFFYDKGGYQYTTADGTITAEMQGTDLVVTHTSGTKIILNEDFEWGDFGINLLDMPDAPTNTITGDLAPILPINYDSLGNVITDPNTPSPDRSDYLYDSTANDRIESKGGSDILHVIRGGDDLVIGGEGNDIVLAGEGDDNVFGENEGEMDDIIAAGETAQNINEKGDLASGGTGNDLVYGSNRKDALFGGEGFDLLVGGGGDDLIYGDSDFTAAQLDWSYTADPGLVNFTNVAFVPGTFKGDDEIYAGTGDDIVFGDGGDDAIYGGDGNDWLFGDASVSDLPANLHGDDFIDGGAGNDWIMGDAGNDYIYGGSGNDTIYADADDIEASFHGDNYVDGEAGNDAILGGAGADTIYGGDGNDTIDGGDGNDYIDGEGGANTILGGSGNDTVYGGNDTNWLQGDEGDDYIEGGAIADTILGGAGADEIWGGNGNDQLHGDADNVAINLQGADTIYGDLGNDAIYGYAGDDVLYGDEGNDTIYGGIGNDYIEGGDGSNTLYGGTGNDTYIIDNPTSWNVITEVDGEGIDTVQSSISYGLWNNIENLILTGDADIDGTGNDLDNVIIGNSAANVLDGGSGNDTLNGGAGNDTMIGGMGNDVFIWSTGMGNDVIQDESGNNMLQFGELNSTDFEHSISPHQGDNGILLKNKDTGEVLTFRNWFAGDGHKIERFQFADRELTGSQVQDMAIATGLVATDGDDTIYVPKSLDTVVHGMDGNDTIYLDDFSIGNNVLYGDAGDDYIDAYGGGWENSHNIICGGTGNDTMVGGRGDDTFIWGTGMGNDCIYRAYRLEKNGTIQFTDLNSTDVEFFVTCQGEAILLKNRNTGEALTLVNWFYGDEYQIDRFQFIDTVLTADQVQEIAEATGIIGTEGDDIIYSYIPGTTVHALGGNDTVYGNGYSFGEDGDDVLIGSYGSNYLDGGAGADTMQGGTGDDTCIVDSLGDVIIEGPKNPSWDHEGDRVLSSITYTLPDNVENLTLTGDADIDGTGNELDNVIIGNSAANILDGGTGNDTMIGGLGDDTFIRGTGVGNDIIYEDGGSDTIRFDSLNSTDITSAHSAYQYDNGILTEINGLLLKNTSTGETITLKNWFEGDRYKIENFQFANETLTASEVEAMATNGWIAGTGDNDTIYGPNRLNAVIGGKGGDDALYGGTERDIVYGEDGNDIIYGGSGNDYLSGGDGNDSLEGGSGNDYINGNAGADTIYGGTGNDTLYGGAGSDSVDGGDGNDSIYGGAGNNLLQGGASADYIEGGINADTILGGTGNDTLYGGAGSDSVDGGDGNDSIYGGAGNNLLQGCAGADYIGGGADADTILGGTGDDTVWGDEGNDYLSGGEGNDSIGGGEGNDSIEGGAGDDTLEGYAGNDTLYGGDGNDLIDGGDDADYINGGAGNDTIYGGFGNNTLCGGDGNDSIISDNGNFTLFGGQGNDTYVYWSAFGNDIIQDDGGSDIVRFNNSSTYGDFNSTNITYILSPYQYDDGIILKINNTKGTIRLQNWFEGDQYKIENFQFLDRTLTASQVEAKVTAGWTMGTNGANTLYGPNDSNAVIDGKGGDDALYGGAGNDTLFGEDGNDFLNGGTGNNWLSGGAGNDTYVVNSSGDIVYETSDTGIDTVLSSVTYTLGTNIENLTLMGTSAINATGNALDNVITGNSSNNLLFGNDGNDTLYGNDGNDTLWGGTGDNVMYGNDGNDMLAGNSGNELFSGDAGDDMMAGAGGNDTLMGGEGSDTYQFSTGSGSDIINDTGAAGGTDMIQFGRFVSRDTIAFFQDSSDLHIAYGDTDYITVLNQDTTGIERVQASNGWYLTDSDINLIIQQMAAHASSNGISLTTVDDVKKNQELMNIVVNSWHQ